MKPARQRVTTRLSQAQVSNMSDKEKKSSFSVPPRAAYTATGLTGTPPLPAGQPLVLKSVSPAERKELEKYGWKDGDPVPANFAKLVKQHKEDATNLDHLPPPVDLKTPPLKMPEEQDINSLSPEKQEQYRIVLESLSDAKLQKVLDDELKQSMSLEADPSVKQAIAASQGMVEELDLGEEIMPAEKKADEFCTHCGWPSDLKDPVVVDDHDKTMFLQSLLGLQPFYKTYKVYKDTLRITLRSLSIEEYDLIFRQLEIDKDQGRTKNNVEHAEALVRYRMCLQIIQLQSDTLNHMLPATLDDWRKKINEERLLKQDFDTVLYPIKTYFFSRINKTETMHRLLSGLLTRYNMLLTKLEVNADNPDFY